MKQAVLLLTLITAIPACDSEAPPMPRVAAVATQTSTQTPKPKPNQTPNALEPPAPAPTSLPIPERLAKPPSDSPFPTDVVLATGPPWIAAAGRSPFPETTGPGASAPKTALRLGEVATASDTQAAPPIAWHHAHQHLDQHITIEGLVVNTHRSKSRVVFLNFDSDWAGKFYVPVFRSAYATMPHAAETFFLNRTVRVTGTVKLFNGTPNIAVSALSQIELVADVADPNAVLD